MSLARNFPPLAAAARRVGSSTIRDLLALTEQPHVISLAGGKPAAATFPIDAIRAATTDVLDRDGAAALQYSATEGFGPLRTWIADRHGVEVDRVTITSGSQQGLDLVARALVDPGDLVVSADPGYVGAIQAFRLAGARLVGIPSDDDGLVVDALATDVLATGLRPRLVYVVADLANPTCTTLSEARRAELVALAERHGFWIVEDDPYGALRWSGSSPRPLAGRSDRVVALGTASKVLCPGLRIGHVLAPAPLGAALVRIKQAADLHTATLTQRVVHELVSRPGFLDAHVAGLPGFYRSQAEAMTTALHRHLGEAVSFAEPEGGMFVWARMPGTDTTRLLDAALAAGVAFVPGSAFAVSRPHEDWLRLSFATASPSEIDEGVHRLARATER